jgi:hypothetical protein
MYGKLALALAGAFAIAMIAWEANAVPSMPAKLSYQNNDVTMIAQGCGRGWHWSARWRRCVRN